MAMFILEMSFVAVGRSYLILRKKTEFFIRSSEFIVGFLFRLNGDQTGVCGFYRRFLISFLRKSGNS